MGHIAVLVAVFTAFSYLI